MRHMHYFYEASENNVHSRIGGGIAFIHRAAESMNFRNPFSPGPFAPERCGPATGGIHRAADRASLLGNLLTIVPVRRTKLVIQFYRQGGPTYIVATGLLGG
jgi:hypothetical protein